MAKVAEYASAFPQFREKYFPALPAGSEITHLMPYPGHYPGDLPDLQRLRAEGKTAEELIPEHYLNFAAALQKRDIALGRLVVSYAPESTLFDREHVQDLYDLCKPLPGVGEAARFAWYEDQLEELLRTCGRYNSPTMTYLWGVQHGLPKESLWSVRVPTEEGLALHAIWRASYELRGTEKPFRGGEVMVAPFQADGDIEMYEAFWYGVYHSDKSMPISAIPEHAVIKT